MGLDVPGAKLGCERWLSSLGKVGEMGAVVRLESLPPTSVSLCLSSVVLRLESNGRNLVVVVVEPTDDDKLAPLLSLGLVGWLHPRYFNLLVLSRFDLPRSSASSAC